MKEQKGITLIALIITIIVMLILVGVSVTVALNGGLFTTAQNATEGTKVEGEKERLLSIVLGTLDNKGIVDSDKLEEALEGTEFTLNDDGTVTSTKTEKTYVVSERGSVTLPSEGGSGTGVTLTWTHTDANSNGTFDVGEVVTASNEESFYFIGFTEDETKVKLLAAECIDTSEKKQSEDYNPVPFDEETNIYANASIRVLVELYVTETLGLEAEKGRLMLKKEAEDLNSIPGYHDMLYGESSHLKFWLGSPDGAENDMVFASCAATGNVYSGPVDYGEYFGLRPVIEISKTAIQ